MDTQQPNPGRDDPPGQRTNQAVGLKAYLDTVAARVKAVPAAWVRCELLILKPGDRFVRMEFVEHDPAGRKIAQVSGGCWPGVYQRITDGFAAVGLRLEPGAKVLVRITSRLDANYGYSVEIEDIDPSYSLGDLKARTEAIRRRLQAAGLWQGNRSLPRPGDFLRVAVIAPGGAAGLGDFRATTDRLAQAGLVEFFFHEAPFQTPQAALRIVEVLRTVWRAHKAAPFCALAIIRGGGAAADLAYLVDDRLTEAVCRMPMPVMTGIGHERDRNLLDEVACISCDTPSKVAEHIRTTVVGAAMAADQAHETIIGQARLVVAHYTREIGEAAAAIDREAREGLRLAEGDVRRALDDLKPDARLALRDAGDRVGAAHDAASAAARERRAAAEAGAGEAWRVIGAAIRDGLRPREREVLEARGAVLRDGPRLLDTAGSAVEAARLAVTTEAAALHCVAEAEVGRSRMLAETLDPATVLSAGYAILRDASGAPLPSVARVASAGLVRAELRDGSVTLMPADASQSTHSQEQQP
ncbi:exodeoxyribonuclease VII large subunit [Paracraurococcus lichenis]|uniref:Exodeoxyribonuclease VII large subunit n=1 Tax=Paracraurococcus lichenis TaxID=3064888 RepID=A0ABT9EDR7_9PROT|nr:exodeoxyribonuclease VII large subunit [Paracraurococcus sp. LOR1-02]MDO9714334.1 exodeoxyribonuclease VII large subunit [Paracraurococcus sp. LOR1-02]